jgi:hypothetical protein
MSFIIVTISFAGTIQLPQTGQANCYDSSGIEVDCAGTGQDGEIHAGVSWPNPRFTDNANGIITDNLTGLMWAKDAGTPSVETCEGGAGAKTWENGLDYVECLNLHNYLGHSDWRLPNIIEIESLINAGTANSAEWLESQGFVNVLYQLGYYNSFYAYASSTTYSASPANIVMGVILDGNIMGGAKSSTGWTIWPVRLGQSGATDPTYPANLWKTGQITSYYSGDDGDLQRGVDWPAPRFTDNNDGTVTDNLTGLIWLKHADCYGAKEWSQTLIDVSTFSNGQCGLVDGSKPGDWRLPNRKELLSLVDFSTYYPALPAGHPFINVPNSAHWCSTSNLSATSKAWAIHIWGGGIFSSPKHSIFPFWPVRDAQATDSVTAPLHDENGLIMTTGDHSNFADRSSYFNYYKSNHNGTDLALSADGSRTGSTDTASTAAHPVYAHAICDGYVVKWNFNKNVPNLSYMQVRHPNCGGRDVIAYYGHIIPKPGLTSEVKKDDILGTVMPYKPINWSHLHLTLDTETQRDLFSIKYEMCDYVLDASTQTVTALSSCVISSSKAKPATNKMLLQIGYGRVTTYRYTNSKGKLFTKSLYISEPAMRQLGFINFFDLY